MLQFLVGTAVKHPLHYGREDTGRKGDEVSRTPGVADRLTRWLRYGRERPACRKRGS